MIADQDTDYGMAFVSAPTDRAEEIARRIVQDKLAACAQVLPAMTSVYWWKGRMEVEPERLILLKTRQSLLERMEALVRQIHPYEVPELTFLRFDGGGAPYWEWMKGILDG